MGVTGLWQLLQPVGRPINVDGLEGKVLAVDVSLWLHQSVKGMRDGEGEAVPNAHLISLFNRVCKLLFLRVRPVFVFDGGVPTLKRRTMIERRERKEESEKKSVKDYDKLLNNYLKQYAIRNKLGTDRPLPAGIKKPRPADMFELPPEPERHNPHDKSYDLWEKHLKYQQYIKENISDLENVDFECDKFKRLPRELQLEILLEMKELRYINHWADIDTLPEGSKDFAIFQMEKVVRQNKLTARLESLRKEINALASGLSSEDIACFSAKKFDTQKVASEDRRHYVLIKGHQELLAAINDKQRRDVRSVLPGSIEDYITGAGSGDGDSLFVLDSGQGCREDQSVGCEIVGFEEGIEGEGRKLNICATGIGGPNSEVSYIDSWYMGDTKDEQSETGSAKRRNCSVNALVMPLSLDDVNSKKLDLPAILAKKWAERNKGKMTVRSQVSGSLNDPPVKEITGVDSHRTLDAYYENIQKSKQNNFTKQSDILENLEDNYSEDSDNDYVEISEATDSEVSRFFSQSTSHVGSPFTQGDTSLCGKEVSVKGDVFFSVSCEVEEENDERRLSETEEWMGNSGDGTKVTKTDEEAEEKKIGDLESGVSEGDGTIQVLVDLNEARYDQLFSSNLFEKHDELDASTVLKPIKIDSDTEDEELVIGHGNESDSEGGDVSEKESEYIGTEINLTEVEDSMRKKVGKEMSEFIEERDSAVSESSGEEIPEIQELSTKRRSVYKTDEVCDDPVVYRSNCMNMTRSPVEADRLDINISRDAEDGKPVYDHSNSSILSDENFVDVSLQESVTTRNSPFLSRENQLKQTSVGDDPVQADDVSVSYLTETMVSGPSCSIEEDSGEFDGLNESDLQELDQDLQAQTQSLQSGIINRERMVATIGEQMYNEAQELLRLFGVPYVVSPMEAEAQCAFLDQSNLTHGTITDDSDVWLFGGQRVYKNFFFTEKMVDFYNLNAIAHKFGLNQDKLIQVGMLCGSDYTSGVFNIGPVTAMEVVTEFCTYGEQTLHAFKQWWDHAQTQMIAPVETKVKARLRKLELPNDFPSDTVYDAYKHPQVDNCLEPFTWQTPDFTALKAYGEKRLHWSTNKVNDILAPVIKRFTEKKSQLQITSFFEQVPPDVEKDRQQIKSKRIKRALIKDKGDYQENEVMTARKRRAAEILTQEKGRTQEAKLQIKAAKLSEKITSKNMTANKTTKRKKKTGTVCENKQKAKIGPNLSESSSESELNESILKHLDKDFDDM